MPLSADLLAIKAAIHVECDHESEWLAPEIEARPTVGPSLVTTIQPSLLGGLQVPRPSDYRLLEAAGTFARIRAAAKPRAEGPEAPEPLGLSMARNSDRPPRHGWQGLPASGRRNVSDALALLEAFRPLLSFWTITLPTPALFHLLWGAGWAKFQDEVRHRLRQLLVKKGLPPLLVGVVEVQPKRLLKKGVFAPHLHIVFQGRHHFRGAWVLTTEDLDGVIKSALLRCGVRMVNDEAWEPFLKSAGNVQQVKKSVRAYLSEYMTKGCDDVAPYAGGFWDRLIPKQWWLWSRECRQMVEAHRINLPQGFIGWVFKNRDVFVERGLIYCFWLDVPQEAYATWRVRWLKTENLALIVSEWMESLEDRTWRALTEVGVYRQRGRSLYGRPLALSGGPSSPEALPLASA